MVMFWIVPVLIKWYNFKILSGLPLNLMEYLVFRKLSIFVSSLYKLLILLFFFSFQTVRLIVMESRNPRDIGMSLRLV